MSPCPFTASTAANSTSSLACMRLTARWYGTVDLNPTAAREPEGTRALGRGWGDVQKHPARRGNGKVGRVSFPRPQPVEKARVAKPMPGWTAKAERKGAERGSA